MNRKTVVNALLILGIILTGLIFIISVSSPQDFCNPCDYSLQPGEVLRVTTLTASTPELLNSEVEVFVEGLTKVVRIDKSQFPEKVTVWHIDYEEPDKSITFFEVEW